MLKKTHHQEHRCETWSKSMHIYYDQFDKSWWFGIKNSNGRRYTVYTTIDYCPFCGVHLTSIENKSGQSPRVG